MEYKIYINDAEVIYKEIPEKTVELEKSESDFFNSLQSVLKIDPQIESMESNLRRNYQSQIEAKNKILLSELQKIDADSEAQKKETYKECFSKIPKSNKWKLVLIILSTLFIVAFYADTTYGSPFFMKLYSIKILLLISAIIIPIIMYKTGKKKLKRYQDNAPDEYKHRSDQININSENKKDPLIKKFAVEKQEIEKNWRKEIEESKTKIIRENEISINFTVKGKVDEAYKKLLANISLIESCNNLTRISYTQTDWRENYGIEYLVEFNTEMTFIGNPGYVASNISIPAISSVRNLIFFYPDKIRVFVSRSYNSMVFNDIKEIAYRSLSLSREKFEIPYAHPISGNFKIKDCMITRNSYQYVKNDGDADSRYQDNFQKPIILFEGVILKNAETGENIGNFFVTKHGVLDNFISAIYSLQNIS